MQPVDQSQVIEFLKSALAENGVPPKMVTTHISVIFLSGERAYKLKRAVEFPFLDFRALEARHDACVREVELNRRTAPQIYKGVVPVTATDDVLELDGSGDVVEWLIEMKRFDDTLLFDRLAGIEKGLRRPVIEELADEISAFHADAEIRTDRGGYGGIRMIAENNVRSFERLQESGIFDPVRVDHVSARTLELIDAQAGVLDARRAAGRVRACHGDLHLRNICLIDGKPTLFDAIEFSRDFSDIDVLYDLAFLLMDLDFHGKERLASFLFNRYLDVGGERADVFSVLPIYLTMRAQIRAHVGAAIAASQSDDADSMRETETARRYLELAEVYLEDATPRLVAVGGLSGSGKSRLAREIAQYLGRRPGARVVRTDVVRKRLAGVHPNEKLGAEGYTNEMTVKTYEMFFAEARDALEQGQCAVLDAVFANEGQRRDAAAVAAACGVPFTGIWVDAPLEVRLERVATRTRNVSDVTVEIATRQSGYDLGQIDWVKVDSGGKKKETVRQALRLLGF